MLAVRIQRAWKLAPNPASSGIVSRGIDDSNFLLGTTRNIKQRGLIQMEPSEKRQKLDQESVYQSNSKESSVDSENLEENKGYIVNAGNIVVDTQLPVCEEGANCNRTDLIHFAEFWHPTKTDENENQYFEENECEVIELAGQDLAATQEIYEEDYSNSESDEEQDYNSNIIRKNEKQHSGSDSLDSRWVLNLWNGLNISST